MRSAKYLVLRSVYKTVFTLLLIGALLVAPDGQFVANSSAQGCPSNEILHLTAYGGSPTTFNLLGAYNPPGFFVAQLEYEAGGYPQRSPLGSPQNYSTVASSVTSNSNYTQWTIHISPSAKWSNGSAVVSQDYVSEWSPNFALNPNFDPLNLHSEIVSIVAPNSNTVVFNLNESDAWFGEKIDTVLDTALYPQSFTSKGADFNGFGTAVTEGPFYVSNYTAGSSTVTLLRNPYYTPQPHVCEIVWNFVESESQDATYIAAGSSDLAPVVPADVSSLLSNPNIHILKQPGEYYEMLSYNVTVYPWNMTAFRQALVYGINESALVQQAFDGYASVAYSSEGGVPSISTWYNPSQVSYSYNPNKALSLLSSIGIRKGADGFLQYPNGTDVSLTIWADTDVTMTTIAAQLIESNLLSLGFKVNLQLTSESTLVGYLFSNTYDAYNGGLVLHTSNAGYPGDPYYDAQPWNVLVDIPQPFDGIYENPPNIQQQYQSNLTALTLTNDPAETRTYLNNIQALNSEYLPVIPLVYGDNVFAYSTAHFTNWPSSNDSYLFETYFWNDTALVSIAPVTSAISAATTQFTSIQGLSSTASVEIALAAVVVVVLAVGTFLALRRRRLSKNR
jgi:peptide/nickel transport system substrate-binding protein